MHHLEAAVTGNEKFADRGDSMSRTSLLPGTVGREIGLLGEQHVQQFDELENVVQCCRLNLYWFSLNWKIARFELAGKGCRPLKRSRDCTGA